MLKRTSKKSKFGRVSWYTLVIPALKKLKQEDLRLSWTTQ
jgi:hypothetical protein